MDESSTAGSGQHTPSWHLLPCSCSTKLPSESMTLRLLTLQLWLMI